MQLRRNPAGQEAVVNTLEPRLYGLSSRCVVLGTYQIQELKRVSYEMGRIPAARCNIKNVASRATLQKAGLLPCARILSGVFRDRLEEDPTSD
jgi:hypothetical protein